MVRDWFSLRCSLWFFDALDQHIRLFRDYVARFGDNIV